MSDISDLIYLRYHIVEQISQKEFQETCCGDLEYECGNPCEGLECYREHLLESYMEHLAGTVYPELLPPGTEEEKLDHLRQVYKDMLLLGIVENPYDPYSLLIDRMMEDMGYWEDEIDDAPLSGSDGDIPF